MKVCLERYDYEDKQTTGKLFVYSEGGELELSLFTLELPWKDNKRRVSCIPEGEYKVIKHISPKFGECLWIQDVPNRSEILVHRGNHHTQILGCVLAGLDLKDINKDGYKDVTSSVKAMKKLLKVVPQEFTLTIEDCRK
jgi:hypothetical protein